MEKPALTLDQYQSVLEGISMLLQRHIDPWGNVARDHIAQELQACWEKTAEWFRCDYPDAPVPAPPWYVVRRGWPGPSSPGSSASRRSN